MKKAPRFKAAKFTGELGKVSYLDLSSLHGAAKRAQDNAVARLEYESRVAAAMEKRTDEVMLLLFKEYGIDKRDPDRWEELAKTLADDLVPAARIEIEKPRGRGAPKKWEPYASAELCATVDQARHDIAKRRNIDFKRVHVIDAIRSVIKQHPTKWPARGGKVISAGSLQNRYNEAKRAVSPLLRLMLGAGVYTGK